MQLEFNMSKQKANREEYLLFFFFKTAQDIFNNKMTCTLGLLFVMLTMWIGNIFLSPIFYNAVQDIFNNKMRGNFVYSLLCSPGGLAISFYLLSLSKCLRYFQQQDEVKFCLLFVMLTLFKLCEIFSILNNSMRYILCLLFVMLTRWVGNICTAPQRITNRGRLLSTQGAKRILPKCNNKRKNRQRVSL